jgi:prolyl-tRNA editing enzyme YbaK/EbsC (Cys-tRNA(Pro) deacylase)
MSQHPNVQAVQDALDAAGARAADGTPSLIRILPAAVHTALAAAAALGVEVAQIANSLIFDADGEPLLVLTSGAHRADPAKLATLAGAAKVRRASPDFVRTHTGQVIGGVAPLGHPKPVRTLVDASLGRYPELWAAGGIPQSVFPITYAELVRVTDAVAAQVAVDA